MHLARRGSKTTIISSIRSKNLLYLSIFKYRSDKRGSGACFYIKETIPFKGRNHSKDGLMEGLFIEIHVINEKLVVTYQLSSTESDKRSWLDSFKSSLSEVTTKENEVIFVTDDTNLDLTYQPK